MTFVPFSSLGVTFLARCVRGCSSIRLNELYVSFATISPRIVSGALLLLCARARASVRRTGRREENSKSDTCCCCCCASSLFTVALSLLYTINTCTLLVFFLSFFCSRSLSLTLRKKYARVRSCISLWACGGLARSRSQVIIAQKSARCVVCSLPETSLSLCPHTKTSVECESREREPVARVISGRGASAPPATRTGASRRERISEKCLDRRKRDRDREREEVREWGVGGRRAPRRRKAEEERERVSRWGPKYLLGLARKLDLFACLLASPWLISRSSWKVLQSSFRSQIFTF